ncbi:hypothetical protein AB0H57_21965 [Micromonospora sp. NPDC050686]|uniref:hypothetical protein n=1 Tax=Micromonospora sp. NPDC050686 TaxID=3154631 RepID=UPI0033D909FC
MDDVAVGAAGDVAGAVVDPRQGLRRLRGTVGGSALPLGVGLVLGFLLARARRPG